MASSKSVDLSKHHPRRRLKPQEGFRDSQVPASPSSHCSHSSSSAQKISSCFPPLFGRLPRSYLVFASSLLYLLVAAAFLHEQTTTHASGKPFSDTNNEALPEQIYALLRTVSHHALLPYYFTLVTFNSCMADSVAPNSVFWLRADQVTACLGVVIILAHHYTSHYRNLMQLIAEFAFGVFWIMYARLAVTPEQYIVRQSLWHLFSVTAAIVDVSTPIWKEALS